jgi:hypothetical protein
MKQAAVSSADQGGGDKIVSSKEECLTPSTMHDRSSEARCEIVAVAVNLYEF